MTTGTAPSSPSLPFDEVVIRLSRQPFYKDNPHAFQATVRRAPAPIDLAGGPFEMEMEKLEAELLTFRSSFALNIEMNRAFAGSLGSDNLTAMEQDLATLGAKLYKMLPTPFQEGFPRLVQYCHDKERGLRLVVEASAHDQADRLLSLPWEIFFAQEHHAYLARTPRLIIIRQLLDAVRAQPFVLRSGYRVLHLIADIPDQPKRPEFLALTEMEKSAIPAAISPERYHLAPNASVEGLERELKAGDYHLFHFLGHGDLSQKHQAQGPRRDTQRGYLLFVDEEGQRQFVTGEQLQQLLASHSTVQAVVLNACLGGAVASGNVALEMSYSGVPYVIGMQSEIGLPAARAFSQAFYNALKQGESIEQAVAQGRANIANTLPGSPEWCLPALYANQGIPEESLLVRLAIRAEGWYIGFAGDNQLPNRLRRWGVVLVAISLLLLLSGTAPPAPDLSVLFYPVLWSPLLPFLVVAAILRTRRLQTAEAWAKKGEWERRDRIRFLTHLLALAGAATGLSLLLLLWGGFLVTVALGFWALLSPLAQGILIGIGFLVTFILTAGITLRGGQGYLGNLAVSRSTDEPWVSIGMALFFPLLLGVGPLLLLLLYPSLSLPPVGLLLMGLGYLGISLMRDS